MENQKERDSTVSKLVWLVWLRETFDGFVGNAHEAALKMFPELDGIKIGEINPDTLSRPKATSEKPKGAVVPGTFENYLHTMRRPKFYNT